MENNELKIKELESKLWNAADELRGNVSSEEYMYIIIGILFIKQMSDVYDNAVNCLKEKHEDWEILSKDKDYLIDYNCNFIVPKKASWNHISKFATSPEIGEVINEAFSEIEKNNDELKGMFEKDYARETLDQMKLGNLISVFANTDLKQFGEDIIGRTYEFFLGKFFLKQGQKGGEFYTPKSIVSLMVNLINPNNGKLYDPCCGTGGMFIQAKQHLVEQKLNGDNLMIFGQENQNKTWKLARINLLLQGFSNDNVKLGHKSADTFHNDLHNGLKVDYILANPPFNIKKWGQEKLLDDTRWNWGIPPSGNANYAWLSLIIDKLNSEGKAAVVLANGSLTTSSKDEKRIRENILKNNLISAIIMLPDKLFYTTQIPACIWIFNKNKKTDEVLFIDSSELGTLVEGSKKNKEFKDEVIKKITNIFEEFEKNNSINEKGFAKSVKLSEIEEKDFSLLPGSYIEIKEDFKRTEEEIKNELKENLDKLNSMLEDSKELEEKLKIAIKKMNL